MAKIKDHAEDCRRLLGKPFLEVHKFLDQYAKIFPPVNSYLDYHRTFLHNSYGIKIIRAKWGYKASMAGLVHLYRDYFEGPIKHMSLKSILKKVPRAMLFFNSLTNEYLPEPYLIKKWKKESLCSLAFKYYREEKQMTKSNYIIEMLLNNKYEAYIVGGAVRDYLLGTKAYDIDIVTSALPDMIEKLFKNHKIKKVGKSFGVILVDDIEVATFRHDKYTGLNDKNVQVKYVKTLKEDLSRRDFTINAMAYDTTKRKIIDYFNGQSDLQRGIIRFVGNPHKRIYEDPNRIVRACRFYSKLNGKFAKSTKDALIEHGNYVKKYVSPERIRLEILKAMKIRKASVFFRSLHEIGVLKFIFPSLDACVNHPHGPHHIEDIFEHNMMCGDAVSPHYPLLKLVGYLHDVGKPISCKINPKTNDFTFIGHTKTGAKILTQELENLKFSNREIEYITSLVFLHMRDINSSHPKSIRKVLVYLNKVEIDYIDLVRLKLADVKANMKVGIQKVSDIKSMLIGIKTEIDRKPPKKFGDLALNGHDVMRITNLNPSPKIGEILNFLFDKVIEEPKLNTKEQLTKIIKEKYETI